MNRIEDKANKYADYINERHFSTLGYIVGYKDALSDIVEWLKFHTDWNEKYTEEGTNPNFGKIEKLIKNIDCEI